MASNATRRLGRSWVHHYPFGIALLLLRGKAWIAEMHTIGRWDGRAAP